MCEQGHQLRVPVKTIETVVTQGPRQVQEGGEERREQKRRGKSVIRQEKRVSWDWVLKGTLLLSIPAEEDRATLRRLNAQGWTLL